jgi:hypothetical protein
MMAVICGTPTPVTTRVVQMEPGPMPTLTASAPARMRSRAASAVAMLPAMTWMLCLALMVADGAEDVGSSGRGRCRR